MDRRRRALLRGLGLTSLGLFGAGCELQELASRLRREDRQIGCPLIVSPIWPKLLVDITSDLAVVQGKYLRASQNFHWGLADNPAELSELIAAQLRAGVNLLLPIGTPAIQAAAAATTTVPIVAVQVADGPDSSVVERLARPGGNLTGAVAVVTRLPERLLELFRQARPDARRVGLLWRPDSTWPAETPARLSAAAAQLGLELQPFELRNPAELEQIVNAAARAEFGGLLLLPEWQTSRLYLRLVELAARARLPLIAPYRRSAELGALLSFGPNLSLLSRSVADLIARVLDGAAPSSLPIQNVDDVELLVNPVAARQTGLTLPRELVARATEVVEAQR